MGSFCSKNNEEGTDSYVQYQRPPDISNCTNENQGWGKGVRSTLSFAEVTNCKRAVVERTAEKEERLLDLTSMLLAANFEQHKEQIKFLPLDLCQVLFATMAKYHLIERSHLGCFAPDSLTDIDLSLCAEVDDEWLRFLSNQSFLMSLNVNMGHNITDYGLSGIDALQRLKDLNLKDCTSIDGSFLRNMLHSTSLVVLNLENCTLDPDKLEPIETMSSLRELYLSGSQGIGRNVQVLRALGELRVLTLGWCPEIHDGALAESLAGLSSLTDLNISYTNASDVSMAAIAKLANLKTLHAAGSLITDTGFEALTMSTSIRYLDVSSTGISDFALRKVGRMVQLESLNISFTEVGNASMSFVCQCPNLESLSMDSCRIGDPVSTCLSRLRKLQCLNLADTEVGDEVALSVRDMHNLRMLNLSHTRLSDSGVKHIGTMSFLEDLRLDLKDLTDMAMRFLSPLTNLRYLDLHGTKISDMGLKHLRFLQKLEGLELCSGYLTDSCGKDLAHMTNLKYLNISLNARLSDEVLQYLASLESLESINLNRTSVSTRGLMENIPNFKSIRQLSIKNCMRIDRSLAPHLVTHFPYLILKEGRS